MVKGLVSKFKPEERQVCTINFNFFTNANLLQSTMEAPLEKKTGSTPDAAVVVEVVVSPVSITLGGKSNFND